MHCKHAHLDILLSVWTISLSAKLREASDILETEYPRGRDPGEICKPYT